MRADSIAPSASGTIACIGNMNNNMFSLMRYLRDLGADAYLLLHDNELEHFRPESDTWNIEKWRPYIRPLSFGNNPRHLLVKSAKVVHSALAPYPLSIGSGLAPAFYQKAGLRLTIFFPYSSGIEWAGIVPSEGRRLSAQYLFHSWVRRKQIAGLRRVRHCTTLDLTGITEQTFDRLGIGFQTMGIPMVYNREIPDESQAPAEILKAKAMFAEHDLVIFSHARHHWRSTPADPWSLRATLLKRNDLLIRAFATYLKSARKRSPLLVLFSYGPDVAKSRELIVELGIGANVTWMPVMSRKLVSLLMRGVDFVVGEFTQEGVWGGTAWEALAVGKPVLQALNISPEIYRQKAGHELPPILDVKKEDDIVRHLKRFEEAPGEYVALGESGRAWFDSNQGLVLARRYLRLLETP